MAGDTGANKPFTDRWQRRFMLNLDQLTGSGSRLNPQKYGAATSNRQDTLTRSQGRMGDLDVPTVKRQSELEGWVMGPH